MSEISMKLLSNLRLIFTFLSILFWIFLDFPRIFSQTSFKFYLISSHFLKLFFQVFQTLHYWIFCLIASSYLIISVSFSSMCLFSLFSRFSAYGATFSAFPLAYESIILSPENLFAYHFWQIFVSSAFYWKKFV